MRSKKFSSSKVERLVGDPKVLSEVLMYLFFINVQDGVIDLEFNVVFDLNSSI